jgi:hypothetical protein
MVNAPIIITATMSAADQKVFDRLRSEHFPPERNFLDAHMTLFHHLPPAALAEIKRRAATLSSELPPPLAMVTGLINLGRGVAYRVESAELMVVRDELADAFKGILTPQDKASPRLHITVQNKVDPATARILMADLAQNFAPRPLAITGLSAFYYMGGPWSAIGQWSFRGKRG